MTALPTADPSSLAANAASPDAPAKFGHRSLTLDGLRGIAIIVVVLGHFRSLGFFWLHYKRSPAWTTWLDWPLRFFDNWGWSGVDLFFVLSGFLITGILIDAKGSPAYFRNFYMRRALRIFPPYYALLIATILVIPQIAPHMTEMSRVAPKMPQWSFWVYLSNYAFAYQGTLMTITGALGHTWTLAVEEQFYMVWPAVVFFLGRRYLAMVCLALLVIGPLMRFGLLMYHSTPVTLLFAEVSSLMRADSLAAGSLLALAYRNPNRWRTCVRWAWAVLIVGGVCVFAMMNWYAHLKGVRGAHLAVPFAILKSMRYTFVLLVASGMLTIGLTAVPGSIVWFALANAPLRFFGKFSYGIYLYHWPVLFIVRFYLLDRSVGWLGSLVGIREALLPNAMLLGLTLGVSLLSWYALERPMLLLKRYFPMFDSRSRDARHGNSPIA